VFFFPFTFTSSFYSASLEHCIVKENLQLTISNVTRNQTNLRCSFLQTKLDTSKLSTFIQYHGQLCGKYSLMYYVDWKATWVAYYCNRAVKKLPLTYVDPSLEWCQDQKLVLCPVPQSKRYEGSHIHGPTQLAASNAWLRQWYHCNGEV